MRKQPFVTSLLLATTFYPASHALADATPVTALNQVSPNLSNPEITEGETFQYNHNNDGTDATKYQGTTTVDSGGGLILNGVQAPTTSTTNTGLNITMNDQSSLAVSNAGASIGSVNGQGNISLNGDLILNNSNNASNSNYAVDFTGMLSGTGNFIYNSSGSVLLTPTASNFTGSIKITSPSLIMGDGQEDKFFSNGGHLIASSVTLNNSGVTILNNGAITAPLQSGTYRSFSLATTGDVLFSGDNTSLGSVTIGGTTSIQASTPTVPALPQSTPYSRVGFIGTLDGITSSSSTAISYLGGGVKSPSSDGSLTINGTVSLTSPVVRNILPSLNTGDVEVERGKITVNGMFSIQSEMDGGSQFDWNLSPKNTGEGKYDDPITVQNLNIMAGFSDYIPFFVTSGGAVTTTLVPMATNGISGNSTSIANSENIKENKILNPGLYRIFEYTNGSIQGGMALSELVPTIDESTEDQTTKNANSKLQLNMINIRNAKLNSDGQTVAGQIDLLVSQNQAPGLFWNGSENTWSAASSDTNWHSFVASSGASDASVGTDSSAWTAGKDAYFVADPTGNGKITITSTTQDPLKVGNIFFANRNGQYTLSGGPLYLQNADTYMSVGSTNPAQEDVNLKAQIDTVLDDSQAPNGSSTLTKDGAGTLILSQDNTYHGTTTIDAGTLQLGDGGTEGKGSINNSQEIDIQRYGALAIDHQNNFDLTQKITSIGGAGEIDQQGSGITTLTGDASSFTGSVKVSDGTLDVENTLGTLSSSTASNSPVDVTVNNGAWLTGNSTGNNKGSIGGTVSIQAGGSIGAIDRTNLPTNTTASIASARADNTPAQSFSINGDLSMAQGSTLATSLTADASGKTTTSVLDVTGKAYLNGAKLSLIDSDYVKKAAASLQLNQAMSILTANGGIYAGTQTSNNQLKSSSSANEIAQAIKAPAVDVSLFTASKYSIANNDTTLDLTLMRNNTNFGDVGTKPNETNTGHALNNISPDSDLYKEFSKITDPAVARQALNNLSGEIHASVRTGLIQDSYMLRNAVLNRLDNTGCEFGKNGQGTYDLQTHRKNDTCDSHHVVLWGQAYGSIGSNGGDGNAATMHHNTTGFIIGADTPFRGSNWRAGGFVSYGHSMFNVGQGRSSSANSNNLSVGGYGGTHWGGLNLRLGASYTWNIINTRRQIAVGAVGGRATSSYLGGTAQSFAELSYKLHAGRTVFEPFANVAYVNMQTNGFRERGTAAALRGRNEDTGMTFSTFGFRAASRFNIGKAVFMPHVMAGYRHAFGNTRSGIQQSFASGSSEMGVNGVLLSRDAAVIDTGVTAHLTNRIDLDVSYIGQYGNHSMDSGATGSFKFRF